MRRAGAWSAGAAYALAALLGLGGLVHTARPAMANPTDHPPKFRPLPPDAVAHMDRQREYVRKLVREHFPAAHLVGGRPDMRVLQQVLDARLLRPDQTWELQSLGVAFGDALVARIDGLAWCEVSDEYGTDSTLRLRQTSFQVNALTMISKRIESGSAVDLEDLAAHVAATLAKVPK